MIASLTDPPRIKVEYDNPILRSPYWLIDSAATSHPSADISLFHTIEQIDPITIETASGESLTANQRGTVRIIIASKTHFQLPSIHISLLNVIYVPKHCANLLSV